MKSGGTNDVAPVAVTAGIVAVWELAVVIFQIPGYVLPSPIQVAAALIQERGILASHGLVTVAEALTGIAISLVFAVILGVVMDCFPLARRGIYPILVATQTVPMIVMAPILIIYMGFGVGPKILTVVLMCFFPVAVSFCDGLAQVDEEYVNLVRSYGAGRWKAYRLVKIPASVPALISGLKVAATYSISGAVVGERLGAQTGQGSSRLCE